MRTSVIVVFVAVPLAMFAAGCNLPGRPAGGPEVPRPERVMSFDKLYGENCSGCHGDKGQGGAATNLANPEYQALIDDATLRDVIAHGEKGTLMPAFSVQAGGELTDAQIDALMKEMRARWSKPNAFGGDMPPPYKGTHAGDPTKGREVYAAACASCHGESALKPGKDGSILDGSLLALINEQTIRTTIIAGRPDIGQPDWRKHIQGHALTDEEITNVTAWLLAQRPALPGQPYPDAQATLGRPGEAQPQAVKK
ncbi:MAG TPA: c-type cytochrome [Terracidiphilus sp.]|jgi:cytochrome c oxidase cbb3-type subunit 3/ubiquinol-cytochrome c reductase cytochrome c subunit